MTIQWMCDAADIMGFYVTHDTDEAIFPPRGHAHLNEQVKKKCNESNAVVSEPLLR